jgi:hypothetical protein
LRSGLFKQKKEKLVFARAWLRGLLGLFEVFFEELRKALNQPPAAADHVQPALVLMFFQNVVQFILEICHQNLRAMYLAL